jgi:hypothetical protein
MALHAPVEELFRDPKHFALVLVARSTIESFELIMEFLVPFDKFLDAGGVLRERNGSGVHAFVGLLHCAVHGFDRPAHTFGIVDGYRGYDIAVGLVKGGHFCDERVCRGNLR